MGGTVLIVDDHPTFRRFARMLLEQAGFTVVGEADDCAGALDAWEALAPDVVLLDVMLPDGSGVDVAATLAARTTSTVILTSSRSASDLGTSIDGTAFLAKSDFTSTAFASLVARHAVG